MQANIVVMGLGIMVVLATFDWLRRQQETVSAGGEAGQTSPGIREEEKPGKRKPLLQGEV